MALSNPRVTITAETIIDGTRAASYTALLDLTNPTNKKVTLNVVHADDSHKVDTRADQEKFEEKVYPILDQITWPV